MTKVDFTHASAALLLCGLSLGCQPTAPTPPSDQPEDTPDEVNQGHPPHAAEPANVVGGFGIQLPDRTLGPGTERFPCWIFPLEVDGPSRIVGGGKLTTSIGLHHGNITTRPITGEGIRPCDGSGGAFGGEATDILAGGSVLFGSSTQFVGEEWQSFPDGMGFPIVDGFEIVARMHYVNPTAEEITVAPSYEWFTIDETTVTHELGPFAWTLTGWTIPPLSEKTVSVNCRPPGDMHVVNVLPHMHQLGTAFFGSYVGGDLDGERWLDSIGYDPDGGVMTQYTPAIDSSVAEQLSFGCTWQNTHDKTIEEGVGDNEMCILFGYAYSYEHAFSAQANAAGGCVMAAPPPPGGD